MTRNIDYTVFGIVISISVWVFWTSFIIAFLLGFVKRTLCPFRIIWMTKINWSLLKSSRHNPSYSFHGPNLVPSPLVKELIGWISDLGKEIVSVLRNAG